MLAVSFFALPKVGYRWNEPDLWAHLGYVLSHANIFHLLCNSLAIAILRGKLRLHIAYMIAVVCSFLPTITAQPIMGISGMVFAIVGMQWGYARRLKDMCRKVLVPTILVGLLPNMAVCIHVYCLMFGYLYGWIASKYVMNNGRRERSKGVMRGEQKT